MMKTLNIDWDSLDGVSKSIRRLKARQRELKKGFESRLDKVSRSKRFEACCSIVDTDISNLYADKSLDESKEYYVYAHLDSSKDLDVSKPLEAYAAVLGMRHVPFYIGKGIRNRAQHMGRNETHKKIVQRLKALGKEPEIFQVRTRLTESEALQLESKLIDVFGLLSNGGNLTNLDEGCNRLARQFLYRNQLLLLHKGNFDRIRKELFVPSRTAPYIESGATLSDTGAAPVISTQMVESVATV